MNQNIDKALRHIELSKKAINEAELILAGLMQGDSVPSVTEKEPVSEPIEAKLNQAGVQYTDITPPRTDLVCYLCESKVYDNRPNKADGSYNPKSPDFSCSNNDDCSGMSQGRDRMMRKGWWIDSKDLPQEWIKTNVSASADEDRVVIDPPQENAGDSGVPFN